MSFCHRAPIGPDPFGEEHEPLGNLIRADPGATLKYTAAAFAGLMAGFIVGCVFGQVSGSTPRQAAPSSPPARSPGSQPPG